MKLFHWLIKCYKQRRLRKAKEKYAYWKGRREELDGAVKFISVHDRFFGDGGRQTKLEAAGKEAMYAERVEIYLRDQ
jgi:hypothetical protein